MKNKKLISLSILFILLITLKVINPQIIQKLSFINYDFYQKVFNRGEVKNITIIDIDEKSIAQIGQILLKSYLKLQIYQIIVRYHLVLSEQR